MSIIDISRRLTSETAVWPGDSPFALVPIMERAQGHSVNVARLDLPIHIGSHIDAPRHFTDAGETVESLALAACWGPAQVISTAKEDGPLYPDDFTDHEIGLAERLLIRSQASHFDPAIFPTQFAYPSPELADLLGSLGVVLFGTDAPSMDAFDDPRLPGHHALHKNGIVILEGLMLADVADGIYELVALPLRIPGADGSPVRALLRPVDRR